MRRIILTATMFLSPLVLGAPADMIDMELCKHVSKNGQTTGTIRKAAEQFETNGSTVKFLELPKEDILVMKVASPKGEALFGFKEFGKKVYLNNIESPGTAPIVRSPAVADSLDLMVVQTFCGSLPEKTKENDNQEAKKPK